MSSWTIHTAPVPASLDAPEAWALHGAAAVTYRNELATWGYADLMYPAPFLLAELAPQPYAIRQVLVAVADSVAQPTADDVVGMAKIGLPVADNTHRADVEVYVSPEHTGRGVGTALHAAAERVVTEHGRTSVIAWTQHAGEPDAGTPDALEPPTGSGRIRADEPGARFARRHGYALEQAERYSVLRLPVDGALLDELADDAVAHAGPDYRVHTWHDAVPEERLGQLAALQARMSTDPPKGGLDIEQSAWDADRVRSWQQRLHEGGLGFVLTAAEHLPTGTLAAYTVLSFPLPWPEIAFQDDTLVAPEHRGHRLGMLVKTANLRALAVERPQAARVHTWNAEENDYMLRINVALGFRRAGVAGAWQKRLG